MDQYEMVEKLRQKANVSYEEAKEALENTNWDILDALVLLENEGKVPGKSPSFTTEEKPQPKAGRKNDFVQALNRFFAAVKHCISFLCRNEFHITWKDGEKTEMTLIILVLFLCLCFPLTVLGMVIGFFCGARFRLVGPDMHKVQITMNAEDEAAQNKQESGSDTQN